MNTAYLYSNLYFPSAGLSGTPLFAPVRRAPRTAANPRPVARRPRTSLLRRSSRRSPAPRRLARLTVACIGLFLAGAGLAAAGTFPAHSSDAASYRAG